VAKGFFFSLLSGVRRPASHLYPIPISPIVRTTSHNLFIQGLDLIFSG
jgi:hypothetical protein